MSDQIPVHVAYEDPIAARRTPCPRSADGHDWVVATLQKPAGWSEETWQAWLRSDQVIDVLQCRHCFHVIIDKAVSIG